MKVLRLGKIRASERAREEPGTSTVARELTPVDRAAPMAILRHLWTTTRSRLNPTDSPWRIIVKISITYCVR